MNTNIDLMEILNKFISWLSTLGPMGAIFVLRLMGRLTRKVLKALIFIALAGLVYGLYTGGFVDLSALGNIFPK